MIQTSNFHHFKHTPDDLRLVSIALYAPQWYKGRSYPVLAPDRDMLKMEESEYRPKYASILARLDPQKVFEDLGEEAILLCWEPPGKFCHRRLVAEWLEEHLGRRVPEVGMDERQKSLFEEKPISRRRI